MPESRVADGSNAKGINSNGSAAASERYVIGRGPDPILHQKEQEMNPPPILYCMDKGKQIENDSQRKYVTEMVTDMTFKVYNSIGIATWYQ